MYGFKINIGVSLEHIITKLYKWDELKEIIEIYKNKSYVVIPNNHIREINVLLRPGETTNIIINAYFHAVILALSYHIKHEPDIAFLKKKTSKNDCLLTRLRDKLRNAENEVIPLLKVANEFTDEEAPIFISELEKKGICTKILNNICINLFLVGFRLGNKFTFHLY